MSYLPIAITAYLLNGFSLIVDKNLVDHSLRNPLVYTFFIGLLSLAVLILIPFGFTAPNLTSLIYASLSGIVFIVAILTFFMVLKKVSLMIVTPLVGTLNPIFSLSLGYLFLHQVLSSNQLIAFMLLITGGLVLTHDLWWNKHPINTTSLLMIFSGFMFGLSYVLLKESFLAGSYINGLVISRAAMAVFVTIFLLFPSARQQIFASRLTRHHFANKTSYLVISSQLAGAISGLLLTYAISLSSPAIVNSLHGTQYLLLLGATYIIGRKDPKFLNETINKKSLGLKITSIILMVTGLYLLAK